MTATSREDAAASFDPLRPKLMRVAYRMLGSVADAEDILQEAFIRWMRADRSDVREPEAFLRRTSRASVSTSSSRRGGNARPISARGFPSPWSKRRKRKTSPCR